MKLSLKSALFSALVGPGIGHLVLKSYRRAAVFIVATLAALYLILGHALDRVNAVVQKINSGQVSLDAESIRQALDESAKLAGANVASMAMFGLVAIWVIALFDAIRIGRFKDRLAESEK